MFYEKRDKNSFRGGCNHASKLAFTLAKSYYAVRCEKSRKVAFTLAEVLTTLGIVGVVSALTIPLLIGKYSDMQRSVALKKAYTNLSQAIFMSQQEHGDTSEWDRAPYHDKGMLEWSNEYIFKYMKKVTACEGGNNKLKCPTDSDKICNAQNGTCSDVKLTMAIYVLADGENIYIYSGGNPVAGKSDFLHILVDTNGVKKPNVYGKDVFVFTLALNDKKTLNTWGCSSSTRGTALRCCENNSEKCSRLLEFDNWEFKSDYPW